MNETDGHKKKSKQEALKLCLNELHYYDKERDIILKFTRQFINKQIDFDTWFDTLEKPGIISLDRSPTMRSKETDEIIESDDEFTEKIKKILIDNKIPILLQKK